MKANIVLAGGGAKGAVLAGCVNAALSKGVAPAGFGGTSAGAIVAFLAAIGYREESLKQLLIETNLADLLDDGGQTIHGIKRDLGWLETAVTSRSAETRGLAILATRLAFHELTTAANDCVASFARLLKSCFAWRRRKDFRSPLVTASLPKRWTTLRLIRFLLAHRGLHEGTRLREWLVARIVERKITTSDLATKLTFAELAAKPECVPLRVVATDAGSRQPVVFGGENDDGVTPVVDAVVASARLPLLFRPHESGPRCLTDGGLSSNLPAFLFEDGYAATRTRTMAFDLVSAPTSRNDSPPEGTGLPYFISLASCAIEASDVLLRQSTAGIEYYAIRVPPDIHALSLHMTKMQRHACYDRGFADASAKIDNAEWYLRMREAGEGVQARLIADHGAPDLFDPVLRAIMDQISSVSDTPLQGPRASIALVTSRGADQKRIIAYSTGMDRDPDSDLELDANAGCSGFAWEKGDVAIADVEGGRNSPEAWRMTSKQYAKIPNRIRSVISAPIVDDPEKAHPGMQPIGTISVDCETPLADTGWVDFAQSKPDERTIDQNVEDILKAWARVVHALLVRAD